MSRESQALPDRIQRNFNDKMLQRRSTYNFFKIDLGAKKESFVILKSHPHLSNEEDSNEYTSFSFLRSLKNEEGTNK